MEQMNINEFVTLAAAGIALLGSILSLFISTRLALQKERRQLLWLKRDISLILSAEHEKIDDIAYGLCGITAEDRERVEGTKRKNQYVRRAILLVLHMVYLAIKLQRHSFFS